MINEYKAVKIPKKSYDKLDDILKSELKFYQETDIEKFDMLSNMNHGEFIGFLISAIDTNIKTYFKVKNNI